ncbi:MAG: UMP kinase [Candidatus Gracilibacteria bacterium]|nr:UMP kinase [Candidatus Gracilibacteria bacterium]
MRVLLKISGEALAENGDGLFDVKVLDFICDSLKDLLKENIQIAIFIGGGNIFRGTDGNSLGIDRVSLDYMGMLSTIMNGIALSEYLQKNKINSKLMTATKIDCVGERFDKKVALKYLDEKNVVIFSGGMWNPYFTTDTGGVLKALEIEANMIIKLTMVDGVYDKDPKKFSDAKMYKEITYDEVLSKNLKVMDSTAIALARDNKLILKIANLSKLGSIKNTILADEGTKVG